MRQSVGLGRVAGIPVGVHWTVAVILVIIAEILGASVLPAALPHQPAVVYWAAAAATALVFAGSLLAHELAHSLVAQRNGVRVRSITLWMLGGVAELAGEPPNAVADLRIALAGPAASLAQAAVFGGVALAVSYSGGSAVAVAAAVWLAVMNGALAVFNMLPGAPQHRSMVAGCCVRCSGGSTRTACGRQWPRRGPAGTSDSPSSRSAWPNCWCGQSGRSLADADRLVPHERGPGRGDRDRGQLGPGRATGS